MKQRRVLDQLWFNNKQYSRQSILGIHNRISVHFIKAGRYVGFYDYQCCGSEIRVVYPESDFFSIPDPNFLIFFHPGSTSKNWSTGILTKKMFFMLSEIWFGLFFPDPDPDFFTYPGSRIQGSKRQRIPDTDTQHWFLWVVYSMNGRYVGFYEMFILWMAAMLVSTGCLFYEWPLCWFLRVVYSMNGRYVGFYELFILWPWRNGRAGWRPPSARRGRAGPRTPLHAPCSPDTRDLVKRQIDGTNLFREIPPPLKVLSSEMDPAEIRLIR